MKADQGLVPSKFKQTICFSRTIEIPRLQVIRNFMIFASEKKAAKLKYLLAQCWMNTNDRWIKPYTFLVTSQRPVALEANSKLKCPHTESALCVSREVWEYERDAAQDNDNDRDRRWQAYFDAHITLTVIVGTANEYILWGADCKTHWILYWRFIL